MKGIHIFCAWQAATAICLTSMEEASSSLASSSTFQPSSSPAIDRHNPIIKDCRRNAKPLSPGYTSQQPVSLETPKIPYKKKNKSIPLKENSDHAGIKHDANSEIEDDGNITATSITRESWGYIKTGFTTPPSSTRYLLSSDKFYLDSSSDFDQNLKFIHGETSKSTLVKNDEPFDVKPHSSSFPVDQVVVLKVSLHCRGCERKMKKHISRMEGVKSFSIDFAAKKVTVTGNLTPLSVLSSISKVKNAQLWPPMISSSIPTTLDPSDLKYMNYYKGARV